MKKIDKLEKTLFGVAGAIVVTGVIGLCVGLNMAKKRGRL